MRTKVAAKDAPSLESRPQERLQYGRGAGVPDPIDVHVGKRVHQLRRRCGLTQSELAAKLGLTFQQIQKYERGTNRISASKLATIATALEVPIAFFFDGLSSADTEESASDQRFHDVMQQPETLDLVRNYYAISDPVRRYFFGLLQAIAATPGMETTPTRDKWSPGRPRRC